MPGSLPANRAAHQGRPPRPSLPRYAARGVAAVLACAAAFSAAPGTATAAPGAVAPGAGPGAAQLALMPLPLAQLAGRGGQKLAVDEESSVETNAEAAEDSIDQDDTASSLAAAGRLTGYELTYSGDGFVSLSSGVDLYRDDAAAAASLAKLVADFRRFKGKEVTAGLTLASVATWTPAGLADEAVGIDAVVDFAGKRARAVAVGFRLGRLIGSATSTGLDSAASRATVEQNARALLGRIRGVLDGTVTGSPVAIPAPPKAGSKAATTRPAGTPDIRPAALALADLPAGARIATESYPAPADDEVVELERDFDIDAVAIGGSRPFSLENNLTLYRTAAGASAFVAAVTAVYRSPQADTLLSESLGGDPDFKGATFVVDRVRAVKLGDEATFVRSTIKAKIGEFRTLFAFVRVGRVVSALIITGPAARMRDADGLMLLGRAAKRAAAVL